MACASILALAGCPQMFVYVPEGAESILPTQSPETSTPGVADKPFFTTTSELGGSPGIINNQTAIYSTDQLVSIECDIESATVYYTLNGTSPDPYSATVLLFDPEHPIATTGDGSTVGIQAIALAPQMYPSEVATVAVSIDFLRASSPSISPAGGTITSDFQITITSQDEGAEVWYTFSTVGPVADPVPGTAARYTAPISVTGNGTHAWVKAVATKTQLKDSLVSHAEYTIAYPQAALPPFDPPEGTYPGDIAVELLCATPGATIWYTTDGSVPDPPAAQVYSAPIPVVGEGTELTIKATAPQMLDSAVTTAHYVVDYAPPDAPMMLAVMTLGPDELHVFWTESPGATGYELYRANAPDGPFNPPAVYAGPDTMYMDLGLPAGTTYWYVVLAAGPGGTSAPSPPMGGTTEAAAPANVSASDGVYSSLVRITWEASAGAVEYRVYRNSAYIGATSNLYYHDTAVTQEVVYTYQVAAYNGEVEGYPSDPDPGHSAAGGLFFPVAPVLSFPDATVYTPIGLAFDGTCYDAVSGGSSGIVSFARHDAAGLLLGAYTSALDFRSVDVNATGDPVAKVIGAGIYTMSQEGVGTLLFDLAGSPDGQAGAVFNEDATQLYLRSGATVYRYSAANGSLQGTFTLQGLTGPELQYGLAQRIATSSTGRIFTFAPDGAGLLGVVSEWDLSGNRVADVIVPVSTPLDSLTWFSFSIAGDRVALYDASTGMWTLWDIGL